MSGLGAQDQHGSGLCLVAHPVGEVTLDFDVMKQESARRHTFMTTNLIRIRNVSLVRVRVFVISFFPQHLTGFILTASSSILFHTL